MSDLTNEQLTALADDARVFQNHFSLPIRPEHLLALLAEVERRRAQDDRWQEALEHVRHCLECGDTDMRYCEQGKTYLDLLGEVPDGE